MKCGQCMTRSELFAKRSTSTTWKALTNHPLTLKHTWHRLKAVIAAPRELDLLNRELIYIAVSVTNGCQYRIASHIAAARSKGLSEAALGELLAIVATATTTNRLVNDYQIPVNEEFKI